MGPVPPLILFRHEVVGICKTHRKLTFLFNNCLPMMNVSDETTCERLIKMFSEYQLIPSAETDPISQT